LSEKALKQYEDARKHQIQKSEARKIRTLVHEARIAKRAAAVRWPFELLQNALDVGPIVGKATVSIKLQDQAGRAIFEHDAAPFSMEELAALLSGGSSKDFESEETTGRFGTGFLVTHVLAERTTLDGIIAVERGYERFHLVLDRGGDEEAILENIDQCSDAIGSAEPLESLDGIPSARFEYTIDDQDAFNLGVESFRAALPYLYGTRPKLGNVQIIDHNGAKESWRAEAATETDFEGGLITERVIHTRAGEMRKTYRISRVSPERSATAAAMILTEQTESQGWKTVIPADTESRVYREYPLPGSTFLPINFVIDGHFEPDRERNRVLMDPAGHDMFTVAFDAAVLGIRYAFDQKWQNRHLLARAVMPKTSFDPNDPAEPDWWRSALGKFVHDISILPIVETTNGMLPAVKPGSNDIADFIQPTLLEEDSQEAETDANRLWSLVDEADGLNPPLREIMNEWSEIARGWATLGLDTSPSLVTVKWLGEWVRGDTEDLGGLTVRGDKNSWLSRYIDIVGECWHNRKGVELAALEKLIPNQHNKLHSLNELRRDIDVSEELKAIGDSLGMDVRKGLVSTDLSETMKDPSLIYGASALSTAIPSQADESAVSAELLEHLKSSLPEGTECSESNLRLQRGTAQFLDYLQRRPDDGVAAIAQQVPLATRGGKVVHWSRERMLMAPVASWNEAARPFYDVYPSDRILADIYEYADESLISALDMWHMIYPDPLVRAPAAELQGERLAEMVLDAFPSEGVIVRGEEFSYIALLQPVIFNHIQAASQAQALLGLVLCYIVKNDPSWQERRLVKGTKDRASIDVPVRDALWLADLRYRAWVPFLGEDDKLAKLPANVTTLASLLDSSWLDKNADAIRFLTACFGFDELDLRLLGISADVQEGVRHGLARILESGGADPDFYETLAQEIETRQRRSRDIERSRRMGYAVQDAVKQALVAFKLTVELVDRGFDYQVTSSNVDNSLEGAAVRFDVGSYFVEVKATSTGPAKLTPLQAETAASAADRYVLCVVDLRDVPEEQLDQDWDSNDIEPRAYILTGLGDQVSGTCVLVHRAHDSAVGIRNEAALRYEVPPEVWMTGVSIADWVEATFNERGSQRPVNE
jgi:hypothetical protein